MLNEGQIRKIADGKYQIRVSLGKDAHGTRRYFTKTINATLKQAREFLKQKLRERDTGTLTSRHDGLLGDWVLYWLENIASVKVRPVTLDQYRFLANNYILPHLGDCRIGDLDRTVIEEWIKALMQAQLGARTIRLAHSVLHNALNGLLKRREIAANAAKGIELPRTQRADVTFLTVEQARTFVQGIKGTPYEALWALMLNTGMRPAEALALRWQDITAGVVSVTRSLTFTSGGFEVADTKTDAGRRKIPLTAEVVSLLAARRDAATYAADKDLIFCTKEGGYLEWRVLKRRHFKPLLKKLGLPDIRGYDLRHTCATLLLEAGVNPSAITQRMGHRSTAFLLDTYGHVLPHQQSEATRKLGEMLSEHHGDAAEGASVSKSTTSATTPPLSD